MTDSELREKIAYLILQSSHAMLERAGHLIQSGAIDFTDKPGHGSYWYAKAIVTALLHFETTQYLPGPSKRRAFTREVNNLRKF